MRKIALSALLAGLVLGASAAQAGNPEASSARIDVAGLDLSKPADRTTLERRVALSLEKVCGSYYQATPTEENEITACRANAKAQTEATVAALVQRQQATRMASR